MEKERSEGIHICVLPGIRKKRVVVVACEHESKREKEKSNLRQSFKLACKSDGGLQGSFYIQCVFRLVRFYIYCTQQRSSIVLFFFPSALRSIFFIVVISSCSLSLPFALSNGARTPFHSATFMEHEKE